ncbi:MAG: DNA replication/repair protein RecF [Armatimonadetes bacterium]|nr:DNA replication/repair protein RecF [Armatimonadota bacterium]
MNVGEIPLGVSSLETRHWRNLVEQRVDLHPRLNVLVGRNAQGKTNLLEAMYLLSTGQILRGSKDAEVICWDETEALVRGVLAESETLLEVQLVGGQRKRARINGSALSRISDLLGRLPSVTFSSQDMALVRGDPAERRTFLDTSLSQLYPGYLQHLANYKRALEQRNVLLRAAQEQNVPDDQFEIWEADMAQHGALLRHRRKQYVLDLHGYGGPILCGLEPGESLAIEYEAKDRHADHEALASALSEGRREEIRRGTSLIGPHRDDLALSINGHRTRTFGSQGQQRSVALSLKMASLKVASEVLGLAPLLLLDDVFAELDRFRQSNLLSLAFDHAGQVIMTCTEVDQIAASALALGQVFSVESGQICRA